MAKKKPTKRKAAPKKRSARSYKLGAQKAAASRQKNKLIKELKQVSLLKTGQKYDFRGEKKSKTTIQNVLLNQIMRINTDFIAPIEKKQQRGKKVKPKKITALKRFQKKEGSFTIANSKVWEKNKFEELVLKNPEITSVNGISIKNNLDKVKTLIDNLFINMDSKSIAGVTIGENMKAMVFVKGGEMDNDFFDDDDENDEIE